MEMPVSADESRLLTDLRERRREFGAMVCRSCERAIEPDQRVVQRLLTQRTAKVLSRADCVYVCECGVSYSNAQDARSRRQIAAAAELNVPEPVRADVNDVLGRAANVTNRKNKAWRFCSDASEDALTWTVLRRLEQNKGLNVFRGADGSETPDLLLWGAGVSGEGADLAARALEAVSVDHGERKDSRSEPDVTLIWPELVVIAEAKYHSQNVRQPKYPNFSRYLGRDGLFSVPCDDVAEAGFYELTRNWVLGVALAERLGRDFLLVNLGPPSLAASAETFAKLVSQTPSSRRFTYRTWSSLMPASLQGGYSWFNEYAAAKQLERM
jgi:hypothetical protein